MNENKVHYCAVCGAHTGSLNQSCVIHAARTLYGSAEDAAEVAAEHARKRDAERSSWGGGFGAEYDMSLSVVRR